jgi:hypothetical protein
MFHILLYATLMGGNGMRENSFMTKGIWMLGWGQLHIKMFTQEWNDMSIEFTGGRNGEHKIVSYNI